MRQRPISLGDNQLKQVLDAAATLPVGLRGRFVDAIMTKLLVSVPPRLRSLVPNKALEGAIQRALVQFRGTP